MHLSLCWIVKNLNAFWLISFCKIIYLKNGLDIVDEYRLEHLYADFYFLCCYPFKCSPFLLVLDLDKQPLKTNQ